jgi:hypothetical protein
LEWDYATVSPQIEACPSLSDVALYVVHALPQHEATTMHAHLQTCDECARELQSLQPVLSTFASWPTELLSPPDTLWERLAQRVGAPVSSPDPEALVELAWENVGPGIACKFLSEDTDQHRISMLVRLAPGAEYPSHTHAGTEELHLLQGELWIDDRKLFAGDYFRAEAGSFDRRVWSETGCTCVLMTSTLDTLHPRPVP